MTLTAKMKATAHLLTSGLTGRAACEQIGINQTTLVRWKKIAAFATYLEELALRAERESHETMRALRCRAVEKLGELLESGNPQVALRAAEAILDRTPAPYGKPSALDPSAKIFEQVLADLAKSESA